MTHLKLVKEPSDEPSDDRRSETERDCERARAEKSAAELVADLMPGVSSMTDEEWAAHDARIAALRASAPEGGDQRSERLGALAERGFPARAIAALRAGAHPPAGVTWYERMRASAIGIVVISGPKGVGKTVAATWLAAARSEPWRFVRAASLLASSRYDRADREQLFSGPLVLDDLGAEYADPKGSFLVDLDELVDVFYGAMRPLVITTNVLATEPAAEPGAAARNPFRERYGERITDRLHECGRWVSMTGESLRRRPTK